jgi:D-aminopeptidase
MVCHQFKGGIGTSSRVLSQAEGGYTVGVLLQANYGSRALLKIAGVPVGMEIPDLLPEPGRNDDEQPGPRRRVEKQQKSSSAPLCPGVEV